MLRRHPGPHLANGFWDFLGKTSIVAPWISWCTIFQWPVPETLKSFDYQEGVLRQRHVDVQVRFSLSGGTDQINISHVQRKNGRLCFQKVTGHSFHAAVAVASLGSCSAVERRRLAKQGGRLVPWSQPSLKVNWCFRTQPFTSDATASPTRNPVASARSKGNDKVAPSPSHSSHARRLHRSSHACRFQTSPKRWALILYIAMGTVPFLWPHTGNPRSPHPQQPWPIHSGSLFLEISPSASHL